MNEPGLSSQAVYREPSEEEKKSRLDHFIELLVNERGEAISLADLVQMPVKQYEEIIPALLTKYYDEFIDSERSNPEEDLHFFINEMSGVIHFEAMKQIRDLPVEEKASGVAPWVDVIHFNPEAKLENVTLRMPVQLRSTSRRILVGEDESLRERGKGAFQDFIDFVRKEEEHRIMSSRGFNEDQVISRATELGDDPEQAKIQFKKLNLFNKMYMVMV